VASNSEVRLTLTAVDKTRAAFESAKQGLQGLHVDAKALVGVLGGLAVTGAAMSFAGTVASAIQAADQLNKLAQRTGLTTEALSELQFAAKLSDVSADSLSIAMKKLNLSISEGLAGDKEKVEMFKKLGISLRDAQGQTITADKALLKIADTFNTAKDGANKTAYAVGLMGKAGDEMIPLLNGGSRAIQEMMDKARRMGLTISTDFAKQAEEFNDNLAILRASGDKLAITMGGDVVSALGSVVAKMAEAAEKGGKLRGIMAGLDELGNKAFDWEGNALRKGIKNAQEDVDHLRAQLSAPIVDLFGQKGQLEAQLQAKLALLQQLNQEYFKFSDKAGGGRGFVNPAYVSPAKQDLGAIRKKAEASEYAKLNEEIERNIALAQAELDANEPLSAADRYRIEQLQKLIEAYQQGKISLKEYIDLEAKAADAADKKKEIEVRDAALKVLAKSREEEIKTREAAIEAAYKDVDALTAEIAKEREHLAVIGMTTAQLAELEAGKLDVAAASKEKLAAEEEENDGDLVLAATYRNQAKLLRDLAAAKRGVSAREADFEIEQRQLESQREMWGDILHISRDFTRDLLTDTSHAVQKLGGNIKSFLIDQMVKLVERQWVIPILAQVTGSPMGLAQAAAGGAGGLGNLLGAGGSLFGGGGSFSIPGIGSAISGGFSAGMTGTTAFASGWGGLGASGAAEMATAGLEIGGGGLLGGLGGAASAGLAAIPVAGWIALGAIALTSMLGDSHGPKQEGGFGPLVDNRGDSGAAQSLAGSIGATYTNIANALGLAQNTLKDVSVFFAKDPQGTAQTQLEVSSGNFARSSLYGGDIENVGRSDSEFTAAVSLASAQLVVAELQKAAAGPVGDYLRGIDLTTASLDTLNTALQTAQDVGTFAKVIDSFGGAFDGLKSLSVQDMEATISGFGGVQAAAGELQAFYDDFTPEAEKNDAIWRRLVSTFTEANVVLPSTRDAFRAAVDAAVAAGDSDVLQVLLGAEQAFNKLYPAIESTAQAADAAASSLDSWQRDYFASWAPAKSALTSTATLAQSAMVSVADAWRGIFSGIRSEVDAIRGGWAKESTPQNLAATRALFQQTLATATGGGRGAQAAAAQLPALAEAMLAIARAQATSRTGLLQLEAVTAQQLSDSLGPLGAQRRLDLRSLAGVAIRAQQLRFGGASSVPREADAVVRQELRANARPSWRASMRDDVRAVAVHTYGTKKNTQTVRDRGVFVRNDPNGTPLVTTT
jgi:hypothetical protein